MIITCKLNMLQPAPRNYSTLEQESYAIIWGTELFEKCLWGRLLIICTDHGALQFLFQGPTKAERMQRSSKLLVHWAELLSTFDYNIEHAKGTDNKFADVLSHLPLHNSETALPELSRDIHWSTLQPRGSL